MTNTVAHPHCYDLGRRVEVLATWYLRFNGFLTTPHFVLHRPDGTQYTEADILGVRFPHSQEDVVTGGPDPALDVRSDLLDVVVAECSAKGAKLNRPWQENFPRHLDYVLRYIGVLQRSALGGLIEGVEASRSLAHECTLPSGERLRLRFVLIARSSNSERRLADVRKIKIVDILKYLRGRFHCYSTDGLPLRSAHSQWDPFIKDLYDRLMPRSIDPRETDTTVRDALDWVLDDGTGQARRG